MRVTCVPAHNPGPFTGEGNNTYLIGGPEVVLIDAGVGEPRHLDELATAVSSHGAGLSAVLVTHGHRDHIAGVETIAARWSDVRFFKLPWPQSDARWEVEWRPLRGGQRIVTGGSIEGGGQEAVEVIPTPGHAPDHVAFWHERSRTVFVGDLVMRHGTVVIPASRGGNLTHYLSSLRRVMALDASRLLPAHGPPIDDPRAVLQQYIRHRELREVQILSAVRSGPATIDSIVDSVYDRLDAALRGAARESVLAHLSKLEEDDAVVRSDDGDGGDHGEHTEWRAR